MNVLKTATMTCLLLTLGALPAQAGGLPPCTSEETVATPDGSLFVYLGDTPEVWEQTNVLPGLQRVSCDDGNGRGLAPDTQIL